MSDLYSTFHKEVVSGIPQRIVNKLDANGEVHADTAGADYLSVTYSAGTYGNWAYHSLYHWYSELADDATSGIFNPGEIDDLGVHYGLNQAQPRNTERIHLRVTDADDGYSITTNYFLKFHKQIEEWVRDPASPEVHPILRTPEESNYAE